MTRKETLLRKKYELKNTLRELRGEQPHDLDFLTSGWKFRKAIEEAREYYLKQDIENLEKSIENQKAANEKTSATETFYNTDEGKAVKAELEAQQAALSAEFQSYENDCLAQLKEFIKGLLGDHWTVRFLSDTEVDFSVWDADKAEYVFGQTIEVRAERNSFLNNDSERFETNVGTTGAFSLCEQNPGDRARFYIDLGKFLGGDLLWLKNFMFGFHDRRSELRKSIREVNSKYENPLGL